MNNFKSYFSILSLVLICTGCFTTEKNNHLDIGRITEPKRPSSLPQNAIWLGGDDGGNWFVFSASGTNNEYEVKQYYEDGTFTSDKYKLQTLDPAAFNEDLNFTLEFGENKKLIVTQEGKKFIFSFIKEIN